MLLDECEMAGEEAAEGLLRTRMALMSSSSLMEGLESESETAFESYWFPRRCSDSSDSSLRHPRGFDGRYEEGAFASFRVANRNNEVGVLRKRWCH